MYTELAAKLPSHHAVTSFMAGQYGKDLFGAALIVLALLLISNLFSRAKA